VEKYLSKISGPLLDRISIQITVRPVEIEALRQRARGEGSGDMRRRAGRAREIQRRRFGPGSATAFNAGVPDQEFRAVCRLEGEAEDLLFSAQKQLRISARGASHVVRVARTIADLEEEKDIAPHHMAEAIQYRIRELPK
jgi:magnesium chelatase family protein